MSYSTPSSPLRIETFYSSTIVTQLQKLSRGGQRLLLFALSRLTNLLDSSHFNRSILISFSDYCSFVQQTYNNQFKHGTVRNAFYDIKNNCDLIVPTESVYSEHFRSVIIVFKQEFIESLHKSDRVALPLDLFITDRGDEMPNYSLALAIYSKASKIKTKSKTITMPIRDLINLLGGKYCDYRNPPKYWKKAYVERISHMLLKYKMLGLITSYSFLYDGEYGVEPYNCDEEPADDPYIFDVIVQQDDMVSNYYWMTRYYRIYVEADVVITI